MKSPTGTSHRNIESFDDSKGRIGRRSDLALLRPAAWRSPATPPLPKAIVRPLPLVVPAQAGTHTPQHVLVGATVVIGMK